MRTRLARLTTVGVVALILGVSAATPALAAAKPFPHVTVKTATAALPTAKSLPVAGAAVKLVDHGLQKSRTIPCAGDKPVLSFPAMDTYIGYRAPVTAGSYVEWQADVAVFANPAAAQSAFKKIVAGEKKCPTVASTPFKGGINSYKRVSSAPDTVNGWAGYRSIDNNINTVTGVGSRPYRLVDQYFTRGNVIVDISLLVSGDISAKKATGWVNTVGVALTKRLAGA